jgi:hypothetical protein
MTFKKGISGNPRGRPPGSADKRARLRAALEGRSDELLEQAVASAKAGDTAVLTFLLGRILPAPRPETAPVTVALPEGSLADRAEALVEAAADGSLPASVAGELLAGLGVVGRLKELGELTKRLEALEARSGGEGK